MSYSFDFTVATKAEAKERVSKEMDEVVRVQQCHARDKVAAVAAAHAFIDILAEEPARDVRVTMHGSVGYQWTATDPYGMLDSTPFSNASLGVSAWHVPKAESVPA